MISKDLEPFWMSVVLVLVGIVLILVGRTFAGLVEARTLGLGVLGASVVEFVYRWRRRALDDQASERLLAAAIGIAGTGLTELWNKRIEATTKIEQAVLKERNSIIVHDSLFFTVETQWQQIINEALARGLAVTLVHAKFGTEAFANRFKVVSPKRDNPHDIDAEWREPLRKQYPDKFKCIPADQLFSGPFVLVGQRQLFLGMWVPGMTSEQLPMFCFDLQGTLGKGIANPLFVWLKGLEVVA